MEGDALTRSAGLALLIPAFEPDEQLLALVRTVCTDPCSQFGVILVVDDGSSARTEPVFAEAADLPRVRVLRQEANRGKGRALKAGMEELLRTNPTLLGIVTADADGQHTPEDIEHVAAALAEGKHCFFLGVRTTEALPEAHGANSSAAKTPLRSSLGNALTRYLFSVLYGRVVHDTQTGLRGFARELLPELLGFPGERYEYEMAVLTHLCRQGVYPKEVPVATVYLEQNRRSHFRPVRDSLRVYLALLQPLLVRRRAFRWGADPSRAQ